MQTYVPPPCTVAPRRRAVLTSAADSTGPACGFAEARTTYGVIGVKAWIFRGEVLTEEEEQQKAMLGG